VKRDRFLNLVDRLSDLSNQVGPDADDLSAMTRATHATAQDARRMKPGDEITARDVQLLREVADGLYTSALNYQAGDLKEGGHAMLRVMLSSVRLEERWLEKR
jgi:hypothetical protein